LASEYKSDEVISRKYIFSGSQTLASLRWATKLGCSEGLSEQEWQLEC